MPCCWYYYIYQKSFSTIFCAAFPRAAAVKRVSGNIDRALLQNIEEVMFNDTKGCERKSSKKLWNSDFFGHAYFRMNRSNMSFMVHVMEDATKIERHAR